AEEQGWRCSVATGGRWAQRRAKARGVAPGVPPPEPPRPVVAEPQHGPLAPRRTAWLVLRRPETRTPGEEQQLAQLAAQQPELAEAVTLARDFAELVRTRQPERLDGWLARATTSAGAALQRVSHGLRRDSAAATAG